MTDAATLEARYRARSLWLDGVPGTLAPRPSLPGDRTCDVAVVGAGFTGLWTAYALACLDPGLRIVVVEREIAGYGAAGRNAGFVSAGIAGQARVYRRTHGDDGVRRAERAMVEGIDWIGDVVAREGIDCGYRKGGSFRVATSVPQLRRVEAAVRARHAAGQTADDVRLCSGDEIREHIRLHDVVGGSFTPHCARVDPARLARGLAAACERRGVVVHERTEARRLEPGRVVCAEGTLRAGTVVRATESYSTRLPGLGRAYLALSSHMLATEPLPAEVWARIGWARGETVADQRHLFLYGQRTPDDRIALGGRGAPTTWANRIRETDEARPAIHAAVEAALRRHLPQADGARVTHRWGGPLAAPRDWSMGVGHDRGTGLAWAGGYAGHGVVASSLAGRTLADLILDRATDLTTLPWVGHRSPTWEPEPVRTAGARAIVAMLGSADALEDRTGRTARRARLVARFTPGR